MPLCTALHRLIIVAKLEVECIASCIECTYAAIRSYTYLGSCRIANLTREKRRRGTAHESHGVVTTCDDSCIYLTG